VTSELPGTKAVSAAAALALLLLVGCGPHRVPLHVSARPADADVFVDDVFVGAVNQLRGRVPVAPGAHRVEIRREGYYRHYADVEVPDTKGGARLEVDLRRKVDALPGTGVDEID
jgi:hypothetical protein